jgi:hypothetical protein
MIRIAVCVVIGDDMTGFFHSPLSDQPAGRLWYEPDRYADKSRADPKSRLGLGHAVFGSLLLTFGATKADAISDCLESLYSLHILLFCS